MKKSPIPTPTALAQPAAATAAEPSPVRERVSMQPLGLSGPAETVYRALLRNPGLGRVALGQLIGGSDESLQQLLQSLASRGLIWRAGGNAVHWQATAPEVAVELLLMERQAELNEARRILPALQEELARDSSVAATTDVQVLPADANTQLQAYLQLYEQARESIVSLVRPPFIVAAPEAMEAARDAARKRGVRIRIIMAPEILGWDGWQAAIAQSSAAGDEIRVLDDLPFKLLLVDGHSAMLPLHASDPEGPVLRLGDTAVLQAVCALFEQLWQAAVPPVDAAALAALPATDSDAAIQELITALAAGANDKTAAHVLGISDRTLQRRIAALSSLLRAKSRFHAGWLAARRFDR